MQKLNVCHFVHFVVYFGYNMEFLSELISSSTRTSWLHFLQDHPHREFCLQRVRLNLELEEETADSTHLYLHIKEV